MAGLHSRQEASDRSPATSSLFVEGPCGGSVSHKIGNSANKRESLSVSGCRVGGSCKVEMNIGRERVSLVEGVRVGMLVESRFTKT